MSVTREDMLRELELLPMWRLRTPAAAHLETVPVAEIATPDVITEVAVTAVIEHLAEPLDVEPAALQTVPEALPGVTDMEISAEIVVLEDSVTDVFAEPLLQTPWLLYCPQVGDESSQRLLQNIMRALGQPDQDVVIHEQDIRAGQVKARFCVLFGLDAANRFLGTQHADIATVRGQVITEGEMAVVITHHPRAMLENPHLKRETWQDLCVLLAKKAESAA